MSADDPILISGATGLVGGRLVAALRARGTPVRVLSRDPARKAQHFGAGVTAFAWDGVAPPAAAIAGTGAVVHLSGEAVFGGLPTAARRRRIRDSRIDSTTAFTRAIADLPSAERPATFVCASAVGIYGDRGDEILDEAAPPGHGPLADVCRDWEQAALRAAESGLRVAQLRIGIVLSRDGGALPQLSIPFRAGLGGRLGSGRQWLPWIHLDDLVALGIAVLDAPSVHGPVNACAPEPIRNADFTRAVGRALGRPTLLPVPAFALRAALGDFASELLDSRRVVPARARSLGFEFGVPDLDVALSRELGSGA